MRINSNSEFHHFITKSFTGYVIIYIRQKNPASHRNSTVQLRESSQRASPMSKLCNIHQDFLVTPYTTGTCAWCLEPGHNAGKYLMVLGGKMWDFVALIWPIRSRVITTLSALVRWWNCLVVPVLVSRDTDLYHVMIHPTWFGPPVGYMSLLVASNLHSEQLSTGLCHGHGSLLLAGQLSHYPQCHNGLAPSRSGHKCLCRSVPRGGSWPGKWEGFLHLLTESTASKALSQSRL